MELCVKHTRLVVTVQPSTRTQRCVGLSDKHMHDDTSETQLSLLLMLHECFSCSHSCKDVRQPQGTGLSHCLTSVPSHPEQVAAATAAEALDAATAAG